MIKTITSIDNPLIKELAKLDSKKERHNQGLFIAEGLRCCSTLVQHGFKPVYLLTLQEHLHETASIDRAQDPIIISKKVLKKISHTTTPSGIVGVFSLPTDSQNITLPEEGLVLININDPGNMGTLFRTCAALSKKSLVIIGGVDPYHPKVVQASAGTIGELTIIMYPSWEDFRRQASEKKISLCALVVKGGKSFKELSFDKTLLIVGNEAHGLDTAITAQCDKLFSLAMPGGTESLNAAIAGSIASYLAWGLNSSL